MKMLHMVSFVLVIIGAVNWGLVGLFNYNLVWMIFGAWPMLVQLIYILVGLSALYLIATHKSDCMWCSGKKKK